MAHEPGDRPGRGPFVGRCWMGYQKARLESAEYTRITSDAVNERITDGIEEMGDGSPKSFRGECRRYEVLRGER